MARELSQVGVVGLGTMGSGIAEVFARAGLGVVAVEQNERALENGRAHVAGSTARAVRRGKMTPEERDALLDRITFASALEDLKDAELVIEVIPERLELKREVFARLDAICPPDTILATNTSSLSVTEIGVATRRPGRVVGMHFFNPAPVMKLVEVVRSVVTEPEVVDDVETLAGRLGKVGVTIGDRAGFVANALLFGYLNHAASMYESGYASREDIDAAMKLGCGLPMGPLALLDLIGLDTAHEILETMYRQSRDRLHAPNPMFRQMTTAGLLGRKSGRGFYTYEGPGSPTVVADRETPAPGAPAVDGARPVRRIGVVGSGAMATGIAATCAKAGYEVLAVTPAEPTGAAIGEVTGPAALEDLAGADLVIEAVAEDLSVKRELFANLDRICRPGAVLATTTSSLPVVECAAATRRPADVVGLHFLDRTQATELVEVVRTVRTGDEALATALAVCERLGKHPVTCRDRAGFVVDALLFPYLNDAVKMLEAHYASADDIDAAMKLGCGYPTGPFELLDAIGLDVAAAIQRQMYLEFREPGFAPAPLLEHLVTAGYLGRKAGRGFRDH